MSSSCVPIQQQKKKKKRQQKISSADGGGGERPTSSSISSLTSCFLCEPGHVLPADWCLSPHVGGPPTREQEVQLERQLERFEWQLRLLKGALTVGGNPDLADLLRRHADQEVCAVVLSFLEKVSAPPAGGGGALREEDFLGVSGSPVLLR